MLKVKTDMPADRGSFALLDMADNNYNHIGPDTRGLKDPNKLDARKFFLQCSTQFVAHFSRIQGLP